MEVPNTLSDGVSSPSTSITVQVKEEIMSAPAVTSNATDGGGCVTSFSSTSKEATDIKPVIIKEEKEEDNGIYFEIDGVEGDGGVNNKESPSSSSSVELPKPMKGLNEIGPPPFLKKTFDMVEDPETDIIVSWSKNQDSFIVWDSHDFSKNMLPKYFKHSNFSSFIRQLNTYGFRKVDPDRWEFANEGFRGGKKHLLNNIKRRSRFNKQQQQVQQGPANAATDLTNRSLEAELKNLKNDQDMLRVEILKLRQQQEDTHNKIVSVKERILAAESKQLQMFLFFTKAAKSPGVLLLQQLIQKSKRKRELDGLQFGKRRRLIENHVCDQQTLPPDTLNTNSQSVNYRNQAQEQLATMQSELSEILPNEVENNNISKLFASPMTDDFCMPMQDHKDNDPFQDMSSVFHMVSEKLMEDEIPFVDKPVFEEVDVNDTQFYLELEDLIGQPRGRGGYPTELVEHTGCVG